MLLLFVFAFLSGLVTIFAPCIWPLLPIILASSSQSKGHWRPLGITLGLMISFAFFTLAIYWLISLLHVDPNLLRWVAVIILLILGLSMIMPSLSSILEALVSRFSGRFVLNSNFNNNEFWTGLLLGISLGIVWTPCAGPIFATIATLAAVGNISLVLIFITIFYVLGVGMPLFILAYGGSLLLTKTSAFSQYSLFVQKIFGIIVVLIALAIATNYDKVVENGLLNLFPNLTNGIENVDNNPAVIRQLNNLKHSGQQYNTQNIDNSSLLDTNYLAPNLLGGTQWLNNPSGAGTNSQPLNLKQLRGKVVLVDFWTYTCINCIRSLTHVTDWYNRYHKYGFVVIGVHTPEFAFEHDTRNVLNAIKMFNIHYPVVQDNNYAIWNAYNNEYWPAEYLIDANGNVRRTDFGEGQYTHMEQAIQLLLRDAGRKVTTGLSSVPDKTPQSQTSPETYIGSDRVEYYYPDETYPSGQNHFTLQNPPVNSFSLGGAWDIKNQYGQTVGRTELEYNFLAQHVYLVLSPGLNKSAMVRVYLDGHQISASQAGSDVKNGVVDINTDRLYDLVDLHGSTKKDVLRLEFETSGTQVFAFTFG